MTALSVRDLLAGYGGPPVLDGLDLDVDEGELVAVLGPSGCGKTTLLRVVAGFEEVQRGTITLAGRQVERLAPERRGIGVVPQEGALFPHLTVAQNVAYGLPRRSSGRVRELLALIGLPDLGKRRPDELSGGQQQRVAVARALATRPPVVLLDEPFSALDAGTRSDMRRMLRTALAATGSSGLLVTHDAGEALSLADRVAVLNEGRIAQIAPPDQLYSAPRTREVARAVGEVDELPGTARGDVVDCALGTLPIIGAAVPAKGPVRILLRPEQIALDDVRPDGGRVGGGIEREQGMPAQKATVLDATFTGADWIVEVRLDDGSPLRARLRARPPAEGSRVEVTCEGPVAVVPDEDRVDGSSG